MYCPFSFLPEKDIRQRWAYVPEDPVLSLHKAVWREDSETGRTVRQNWQVAVLGASH